MVELLVATAARPARWSSSRRTSGRGPELGGTRPRRAAASSTAWHAPETAQLATIVARAALDADDARRIHERTQGNPLFIGETVRASIEDGTPRVARRPDGAHRTGRAAPAADPASRARRAASTASTSRRATCSGSRRSSASRSGHDELEDLLGEPVAPGTLDRLVDAALIVPSARTGHGASATRWSTTPRMPGSWQRAGGASTPGSRIGSRPVRGRSRSRRSRSTARPPAMPRRAIPLLVEAAAAALAVGAPPRRPAFWRNAADLASDPATIARFRAAAGAALEARVGPSGRAAPTARRRPRSSRRDRQAQTGRRPVGSTGRPRRTGASRSPDESGRVVDEQRRPAPGRGRGRSPRRPSGGRARGRRRRRRPQGGLDEQQVGAAGEFDHRLARARVAGVDEPGPVGRLDRDAPGRDVVAAAAGTGPSAADRERPRPGRTRRPRRRRRRSPVARRSPTPGHRAGAARPAAGGRAAARAAAGPREQVAERRPGRGSGRRACGR